MTWVAYRKESWGLLTRLSKLKAKEYQAALREAESRFQKEAKDKSLIVKQPMGD